MKRREKCSVSGTVSRSTLPSFRQSNDTDEVRGDIYNVMSKMIVNEKCLNDEHLTASVGIFP